MTTLKPRLVRADTLDLQAHDAPSAKDHTRQPTHPAPYGSGPAAPHQTQALRNVERDTYQEHQLGLPVSNERTQDAFPEEPNFYEEPDDDYDNDHGDDGGRPNGVQHAEDDAEDGHDGDEDMEDDLMDKMSSSPSIDDGKYTLPIWPPRRDSADSGDTRSSLSTPIRGSFHPPSSSSPFTCTLEHFPVALAKEKGAPPTSHQDGEYGRDSGNADATTEMAKTQCHGVTTSDEAAHDHHLDRYFAANSPDFNVGLDAITKYLLPANDPLLDNSFDDAVGLEYVDDDSDWEDEGDHAMLHEGSDCDDDDDDDTGIFQFSDDPRFIDSGWGGECLREVEDIDFEFVYALHTFVATVEGQANATKGDTMVLLDDSNSYWWLVRVVKDGSIGYLPAEHIETPTERLARLNKHRNIDLSATMLGDNPEKSKNPLKKAMRRRNAKTVQFTAPTYYEPSDYEYSDEEEEEEDEDGEPLDAGAGGLQTDGQDQQQESTVEEPEAAVISDALHQRPMVNGTRPVTSSEGVNGVRQVESEKSDDPDTVVINDDYEAGYGRSKNGTVRNTDSFFKDDNVETKKISLTPQLLRGNSENSVQQEPQDLKTRTSQETFDKLLGVDDKLKDEKKKKEKKGMLGGLFKRKDKTSKPAKSDGDDSEKTSVESVRPSPQSKDSLESLSSRTENSLERKPSKLQKQPPPSSSPPKASPIENKPSAKETFPAPGQSTESTTDYAPAGPVPAPPVQQPAEIARHPSQSNAAVAAVKSSDSSMGRASTPTEKKSIFAPLTTALRPSPSNASMDGDVVKPVQSNRAKNRYALEDGDSDDGQLAMTDIRAHTSISPITDRTLLHAPPSGSPVSDDLSQQEEPTVQKPPALMVKTSSNTSLPLGSTSLDTQPTRTSESRQEERERANRTPKPASTADGLTPSTSRSTPTWSDASLRSYMDNDPYIKDLLIIIHDSSHIQPAGPDHPYAGTLFQQERNRLAEMQSNLDSMLTTWLSKKNSTLLSR